MICTNYPCHSISKVKISTDALRMRCRRMCEKKASGRCNVEQTISDQYRSGGEGRETLEMALLECLATHGLDRRAYKKIKECKLFPFVLFARKAQGSFMTILRCKSVSVNPRVRLSIHVKADFIQKCKVIKERLESREQEVAGRWMTECHMKKSGLFSPAEIKSMIAYCKRFPETLTRPDEYVGIPKTQQ